MAYVSKELKAEIMADIKQASKDLGIKFVATSKVTNYSTITVNIKSCAVDLKANLIETLEERIRKIESREVPHIGLEALNNLTEKLNQNREVRSEDDYFQGLYFNEDDYKNYFTGDALKVVEAVYKALTKNYYDKSDGMTDYYNTAYYYNLHIGDNKGGFIHKAA